MSAPLLATPAGKPRARALGIPFEGRPGPLNAITDVPGVEVGHCTLIEGAGPLVPGEGPVRTGVTAILPRGRDRAGATVWAGMHALNGNGELTGAWWLEEVGRFSGPITLTNTHSCGLARDATIEWLHRRAARGAPTGDLPAWSLPVAGETWDGWLNDINGFHVRREHVWRALDDARPGQPEEGSVGGGTGMMLYGHKGGFGTASRRVGDWTVGAAVQANFGLRRQLVVAGVPMAAHLPGPDPYAADTGSIIAVIATDAPLIGHQLRRLARRVSLGVGRSGSISGHGSGDIFLALSTAGAEALSDPKAEMLSLRMLPDDRLDPLFEAVIRAVDEAILNVLAVSEPMEGRDGHRAEGLDRAALTAALKAAGRWVAPPGLPDA